jgi:hypothetical protein
LLALGGLPGGAADSFPASGRHRKGVKDVFSGGLGELLVLGPKFMERWASSDVDGGTLERFFEPQDAVVLGFDPGGDFLDDDTQIP